MTEVGTHSRPIDGTVTSNGHQLVPLAMPLQQRGDVSALPQPNGAERPRTAANKAGRLGRFRGYPWPLLVIAAPAAVAIWSGWVGLGEMCGFGPIRPLPGIVPSLTINTAITLPVGVEAYGTYALHIWLGKKDISARTRMWARNSALGALALGCLGQIAFHLLAAAHVAAAPWPVVTAVSCLPVATLALAAALAHMVSADSRPAAAEDDTATTVTATVVTPRHDGDHDKGDKPQRKQVTRKAAPAMTKQARAAAILRDNPGLKNRELEALTGGDIDIRTFQRARNGSKP